MIISHNTSHQTHQAKTHGGHRGVNNNSNNNTMINGSCTNNTNISSEQHRLIENRSTNGSCTTDMSDQRNDILKYAAQNNAQNTQRFGTTGTTSWSFHQPQHQPQIQESVGYQMPMNTSILPACQLTNTSLLPQNICRNDIPEIDVDDLIMDDQSLGLNNDIQITKGQLNTQPNMNDSERFEIPIAVLDFKDTFKANRYMFHLVNSKNCPYILKAEGKMTIANCVSGASQVDISHRSPSSDRERDRENGLSASPAIISQSVKIITEDIEYISLRTFLQKHDNKLSYNDRLELINQCCQAITYAHNTLNHTFDKLTIDNFVVNSNNDVRLLHFDETWASVNTLDMFKYVPNNEYTPSFFNNVWQFGVIIYEIISCPHTFSYSDIDRNQVRELLSSTGPSGQQIRQSIPKGPCSQVLYKLMLDCWMGDPLSRPSMMDCSNSIRKILTNSTTIHKTKKRAERAEKLNKIKQANQPSSSSVNPSTQPQKVTHRSYSSIGTLETSSNEGQNIPRPHINVNKSHRAISQTYTHASNNASNTQTNQVGSNQNSATSAAARILNTSSNVNVNVSPNSSKLTNVTASMNNKGKGSNVRASNGRLSSVVGNDDNTCALVRGSVSGAGTIVEV